MQAASRVIVCFSSVIFFCFFFLLFFFVCFHSLLVLILARPGCSISRAVTFPAGPPEGIGGHGGTTKFSQIFHFFHYFRFTFFLWSCPHQVFRPSDTPAFGCYCSSSSQSVTCFSFSVKLHAETKGIYIISVNSFDLKKCRQNFVK